LVAQSSSGLSRFGSRPAKAMAVSQMVLFYRCVLPVCYGMGHMDASTIIATIRRKSNLLRPVMTELLRRQWAAIEALTPPRGGMTVVVEATGMSY
jgi:hypothetical protein